MAGTKEGSREVRDGMLTLRISVDAAAKTLALVGELDMANAATLAGELEKLEAGTEPITIDMRELEFIDSTGIAVLVAAYRRAKGEGEGEGEGRLRFIRSEATGVQRVMDVTGLEKELPFVG
jgi:anti-sigma B factor antagonist